MLAGLIIVLLLVLTLPFVIKPIERNLEPFLFVMGLAATIIAGVLNWELVTHIMYQHHDVHDHSSSSCLWVIVRLFSKSDAQMD